MPNKMLIDASHPEETRVVVLRGNRVEEFDFESASKKQLRGNIYLAKVTRVEPSLQAAFIDYGGNRHGFLAFSEIHPDYYQIPIADRQALIEEEARAQRAEEETESRASTQRRSRRHNGRSGAAQRRGPEDEIVSEPAEAGNVEEVGYPAEHDHIEDLQASDDPRAAPEFSPEHEEHEDAARPEHDAGLPAAEPAAVESEPPAAVEATALETILISPGAVLPVARDADEADAAGEPGPRRDDLEADSPDDDAHDDDHDEADRHHAADARSPAGDDHDEADRHHAADARSPAGDDEEPESDEDDAEASVIEQIGGDALEEVPYRPQRLRRAYKIQEVIKRRQVLLVQVAKEERGNKGAALTTYLSLAGRYSVLMPNTARGGGISRKITNALDRKRLKTIAEDLEVPEGMGIILRTAGASRTKAEVKRDFEYLLRMWETVRELTLKSTAPMLVYEEGSLIKRAIRDLYNKDIDEVLVAGGEGHREARDFMRLLMPSHAKNVKLYGDPEPMFVKAGAESQLDAMFASQVTLKSGGYIVINQTEALVAIDVNSGRSTREHNIEDTALRTNMEAADEVARQLRLRDLAGLIVVDFIDMEESRNNRSVERRMKDALKFDRARIQIGRISHFGLLEMSRQRIRTGVLEGSTVLCAHCMGAGMVRSTSSIALHVLRSLEEGLIRNSNYNMILYTRLEVALYILNQKRAHLREIEGRFGVSVNVLADPALTGTVYHAVERGEPVDVETVIRKRAELVRVDSVRPVYDDEDEDEAQEAIEPDEIEAAPLAVEDRSDETDESSDGAESDEDAPNGGGQSDLDADGTRRRRRRRRRRGRDRDGRSLISANAPQPSDDGLAAVGEITGLTPVYKGNGALPDHPDFGDHRDLDPVPPEEPVSLETSLPETIQAVPDDAAEEAPTAPPPHLDAAPAKVEPDEPEPVEVTSQDVTPDKANTDASTPDGVADALPGAGEVEASALHAVESEVEDPRLPKRSGWWQRAKATFGG